MYSMPIVTTNATLYFPSESGQNPIVTGCVRTNGSGCAKTSDTTKRYFGTEHGSELEMTPGELNIKGGSKEPLSISFDDKVGVTLKSPKKLSLNADTEIIMKTPKSVKLKAESQILVAKKGTQSGFSIETDMHFLSDNVIKNGSAREAYSPFGDEPKAGKKPDPPKPKPKEEKKGFSWGKLFKNVVAAVAVVAVVAVAAAAIAVTAGAATGVVVAIAAGAAIAGTAAVASQAISDVKRGEVSDMSSYIAAGAREALVGAISGAIFGPFGATEALSGKMLLGGVTNGCESVLRQTLEGKGINFKTVLFDAGIGGLTAGLFHGAGKAFEKASPFVKKAFNKVSDKITSGTKNVLNKTAQSLDNALNGINRKVDELAYNMRKNLGLELQPAGGADFYSPPEESTFFKDRISKMIKSDEGSSGGKKVLGDEGKGHKPRYGERQISDEEYDMLREQTPTKKLRDKVNEGHDKTKLTNDEVLPGKKFKGALEADHIVAMDRVTRMDGFGKLTDAQKLEVLNNRENFMGLSKSANTSKQSKTYEEWTHYKKGKKGEIEINPEFRKKMIEKERELERKLQKQIDEFNKQNKGDD